MSEIEHKLKEYAQQYANPLKGDLQIARQTITDLREQLSQARADERRKVLEEVEELIRAKIPDEFGATPQIHERILLWREIRSLRGIEMPELKGYSDESLKKQ